jgi:hypothetical protein
VRSARSCGTSGVELLRSRLLCWQRLSASEAVPSSLLLLSPALLLHNSHSIEEEDGLLTVKLHSLNNTAAHYERQIARLDARLGRARAEAAEIAALLEAQRGEAAAAAGAAAVSEAAAAEAAAAAAAAEAAAAARAAQRAMGAAATDAAAARWGGAHEPAARAATEEAWAAEEAAGATSRLAKRKAALARLEQLLDDGDDADDADAALQKKPPPPPPPHVDDARAANLTYARKMFGSAGRSRAGGV